MIESLSTNLILETACLNSRKLLSMHFDKITVQFFLYIIFYCTANRIGGGGAIFLLLLTKLPKINVTKINLLYFYIKNSDFFL